MAARLTARRVGRPWQHLAARIRWEGTNFYSFGESCLLVALGLVPALALVLVYCH